MLEVIRDQIERGIYPPGRRLPSERKLAREFGVPQSRVRKALQALVGEGYLESLRGNGYFLRGRSPGGRKLHKVAFCIENPGAGDGDFYSELLFQKAAEFDLELKVALLPDSPAERNSMLLGQLDSGVDGIICFPHFFENLLPALLEIKKRALPFIFWDYSPFRGVFPAVGVDHFQSCFEAARVLAELKRPVVYIGFEGMEQNRLKYEGFLAGCRTFGIAMEPPVMIPYSEVLTSRPLRPYLENIEPGKLFFASTRLLSETLVGTMMDRGFLPVRDYSLLATDKLTIMEGCSLQLDCMMRDREGIVKVLLGSMRDAILKRQPLYYDYRLPMRYLPGRSLR